MRTRSIGSGSWALARAAAATVAAQRDIGPAVVEPLAIRRQVVRERQLAEGGDDLHGLVFGELRLLDEMIGGRLGRHLFGLRGEPQDLVARPSALAAQPVPQLAPQLVDVDVRWLLIEASGVTVVGCDLRGYGRAPSSGGQGASSGSATAAARTTRCVRGSVHNKPGGSCVRRRGSGWSGGRRSPTPSAASAAQVASVSSRSIAASSAARGATGASGSEALDTTSGRVPPILDHQGGWSVGISNCQSRLRGSGTFIPSS